MLETQPRTHLDISKKTKTKSLAVVTSLHDQHPNDLADFAFTELKMKTECNGMTT